MKLFKITIGVPRDTLFKVTEYEVDVLKKTYRLKNGNLIKKAALMNVDSNMLNNITGEKSSIYFHVWCEKEDLEVAKNKLKSAINTRFGELEKGLKMLRENIHKHYVNH